jgi:hypothetical protein
MILEQLALIADAELGLRSARSPDERTRYPGAAMRLVPDTVAFIRATFPFHVTKALKCQLFRHKPA